MKNLTIIALLVSLLLMGCKKEVVNTTYEGQVNFSPQNAGQLQIDLKGKTVINGTLILSKMPNENFNVLNSIKKINGHLIISDTKITDLSFLSALEEVSGDIKLEGNLNIISTKGLEKIQKVKSLSIYGQNNTIDLNPIQNITIEENFILSYLQNLILPSFKNITNLKGYLFLMNNGFENIDFLPNLKSVQGTITIGNNSKLIDLIGIEQLTTAGGDLTIIENNALQTLKGLDNLQEVSNRFNIVFNKELKSISSLGKLNKVGIFQLALSACENLNSLGNLTSAAGIDIRGNAKLSNFCGIKPVLLSNTIINNQLYIENNLQNPTAAEIKTICQ